MTCFRDLLTAAERALTSLSNGLAPCLYAQRQAKVMQAYSEATRAATTALQRSEAQLSLCSAYLIFAQKEAGSLNSLKCVHHSLSHLTCAADQASTSAIESAYVAWRRSARGALSNLDLDLNDILSFWTRVVSSTARQVVLKCKLSMDQAEWILNYGQRCMVAGSDYKTGLKCGHEAAGPVEVAIQSAQRLKDSVLVKKAEALKEAIYTFIRCTCESAQARVQADRQLASFGPHPHEEEVWQVVDKYTLALRQTEEQDLLNECCAHARLGGVFDRHLKMRNKAVLNCKRAVQLAHHIKPHPTGHEWYMDCQRILARIQREQAAEEQAKQDEDQAEILKELEPQLKKIKAAKAKGARDFLVHIKQSHPPKLRVTWLSQLMIISGRP
ncbi:TPA: hypothetical protein ACH3X2_000517 [Trebouxia sp. C0005]